METNSLGLQKDRIQFYIGGTIMKAIATIIIAVSLLSPTIAMAAGQHGHNHNHFNPALEQLGNDIIGLTVCYKNQYLSDTDQEPAFKNLIKHAGVTGEELGMYYMDSLGAKAEAIMGDDDARALWTKDYCNELTQTYLDEEKLTAYIHANQDHDHNHGHSHVHSQGPLSAEIRQQDIERGRLLAIK